MEKKKSFAQRINFYKLVWVFVLCSILGYLLEMAWCYLYHGFFESRKSLIYGPFTIVYGLGAVCIVLLIQLFKKQGSLTIFGVTAAFSIVFEYGCSFLQEKIFGTVSWYYGDSIFSVGGRANWLFALVWGAMAIVVMKVVLPAMNRLIESIPNRAGLILTWVMIVGMSVNMFLSASAVYRQNERRLGIEPGNRYEVFLDEKYPDERLNEIYVNMRPAGTALIRDENGRVVK